MTIDEIQKIIDKYKTSRVTAEEVLTSNGQYPKNVDYFMLNAKENMTKNLDRLLKYLNILRDAIGVPFIITSGYRTPEYNKKIGGALHSLHCTCQAVDILDKKGEIDNWLLCAYIDEQAISDKTKDTLRQRTAIENPYYTKNWCHFQIVKPYGKKNTFIPYVGKVKDNERDDRFGIFGNF